MRRALVIAPHHDDECIGCGGLIAKLSDAGWEVGIVVVFDPLEGRSSAAGAQRLREADEAARALAARRLGDVGIPCRAGTTDEAIIWPLVERIRQFTPSILLMPHRHERDAEHRQAYRAAVESLWLSESPHRPEIGDPAPAIALALGYEVWTPIAEPTCTIDIAGELERKLGALQCYASQLEILDLAGATRGLARYRGAMNGQCTWAESFTTVRLRAAALSLAPWLVT